MKTAIPKIREPEKFIYHAFEEAAFVEVTKETGLDVCMQYPLLGMQNAEPRCLMREEVLERLLRAQEYLPEGFFLRIWDAWRPFALQKELYEEYAEDIIEQFGLDKVSEQERMRIVASYISLPIADRNCPPVHTTGGAVDVTLIDAQGRELNMGTAFDAFSTKTHTAYFEDADDAEEEEIRDNRRILYHAMTKAGFTNLPSEWWHYDFGDRFWAYYRQDPAIYKGVFSLEEVTEE